MKFRPMLAASFDDPQLVESGLERLQYPLLCSPKVDGIRWMKPVGEPAMSRSWKPLPNRFFQNFMHNNAHILDFMDGEVIVGDDITLPNLFNQTQSLIMSEDVDLPFTLYVFDSWIDPAIPFGKRTRRTQSIIDYAAHSRIKYLYHVYANNSEEVLKLEEAALEEGYEGLMLRSPLGTYKFGRSTLKQQGLIKIKRFVDEEARVVGYEELERNTNEPTKNAFGLQVRSSHKAGKVGGGTLGKLLVSNDKWGQFSIGSGLDSSMRDEIWANRPKYLNRIVSYKYQPHGSVAKPRSPIFKGFRPELE